MAELVMEGQITKPQRVVDVEYQVESIDDAPYILDKESELVPPCINKLLSMRSPETPTPTQSFHLACWLLDKGYDIEECKNVFREIFQEKYDEDTADIHLKLIKGKNYRPYHCFMVKHGLGICSTDCPHHDKI